MSLKALTRTGGAVRTAVPIEVRSTGSSAFRIVTLAALAGLVVLNPAAFAKAAGIGSGILHTLVKGS